MARLSVNLNKVALLRNSRHTGVPDVLRFARIAHDAGADGLTVHPRPDERHIRRSDVPALAELMRPWRPGCELNIEGYPDERLFEIVREVRPGAMHPGARPARRLHLGGRLEARRQRRRDCRDRLAALKPLGCRIILFVDPDPDGRRASGQYRGRRHRNLYRYLCRRVPRRRRRRELRACAETASRAGALGLVVNAGHDLNLRTCRASSPRCRTWRKPRSATN